MSASQQIQQAASAPNPNRWLTTVKLLATWECVCGNHHQVNVLTDDDPICAACGRKWTLTLSPAGLDIHYDDPPTTTRGPTLRQVSEAVR